MAKANSTIINVLRTTADRLEAGADYKWTHQGRCNCGHLVQTTTGLGAAEINRRAQTKPGEWSEHGVHYCPVSEHPLDDVIRVLEEIGFSPLDLGHIEYLSDRTVSKATRQRSKNRYLDYRDRDDVILYFRTWADLLEAELLAAEGFHSPEKPTKPVLLSTT